MLSPGELTLGGKLNIGPGGKSRNMAQMTAAFLGKNKVAMISRISKDHLGLWEFPLQSLIDSGVDTTYVKILSFDDSGHKYPGIALIRIDKNGKNEIYVLPGVNEDFSCKDIDGADILFTNKTKQKIMILALEIPIETVTYCIEKAVANKIRVILDPGGINGSIDEILNHNIFFIKPNEHETRAMTGIKIINFETAETASQVLRPPALLWMLLINQELPILKGKQILLQKQIIFLKRQSNPLFVGLFRITVF